MQGIPAKANTSIDLIGLSFTDMPSPSQNEPTMHANVNV